MTTKYVLPFIAEAVAKGAGVDYSTPSLELPLGATGFTVTGLSTVAGTITIWEDISATGEPAEDFRPYTTQTPHVANWQYFDSAVLNPAVTTVTPCGFYKSPIKVTIASAAAGTVSVSVQVTGMAY